MLPGEADSLVADALQAARDGLAHANWLKRFLAPSAETLEREANDLHAAQDLLGDVIYRWNHFMDTAQDLAGELWTERGLDERRAAAAAVLGTVDVAGTARKAAEDVGAAVRSLIPWWLPWLVIGGGAAVLAVAYSPTVNAVARRAWGDR